MRARSCSSRLQHLQVPTGIERDAVVSQHKLPPLNSRQSGNLDHRYVASPTPRRRKAAMPGDDVAFFANQDRIGKAESSDAAGDFGDLLVGVRARIAG